MARGWVHTTPRGGDWTNQIEGDDDYRTHARKEDAVAEGRQMAIDRQTEHVIHKGAGTISERHSYRNKSD